MNPHPMPLDSYISQVVANLQTSIKAACTMYGDAEAMAEVEAQLTPVLTELEDKLTELHKDGDDNLDRADTDLNLNDVATICPTCEGLGTIVVRGQEVDCSRCSGGGLLPPENPKG